MRREIGLRYGIEGVRNNDGHVIFGAVPHAPMAHPLTHENLWGRGSGSAQSPGRAGAPSAQVLSSLHFRNRIISCDCEL
jgi:hypothetical protein